MSQALYRKYRSRSLDEVLGQDHVTNILRRALEQGKIAHAYLLTGPRGVGKTSVARILAHEINQLPYDEEASHLDIIEIDAASNNGVDDIRMLREKAQVAPVSATKKIYIIDEVHMLSKPAFNALLKTLEEPPAHIVFILATTDVDKLPATILSRVQQFYFRPISVEVMTRQLMNIAKQEGFRIDEAAAQMIAERSNGGFRDSISLLDQLSPLASAEQPLSAEQVAAHLGLSSHDVIKELIDTYRQQDPQAALTTLQRLEQQGADPLITTAQLLNELRAIIHQQPEMVELIQQLIEVTKHPHPDLKLLTIFTATSAKSPAIEPKASPIVEKKPATPAKKPTPSPPKEEPTPPEEKPAASPKKKSSNEQTPTSLDWNAVVSEVKSKSLALATLLQACTWAIDEATLTIYAGNGFTKKKLDDAKNRPLLTEAIENVCGTELDVTIIGKKQPPKNKQLAEIAAMMGGGEEVKLEDLK